MSVDALDRKNPGNPFRSKAYLPWLLSRGLAKQFRWKVEMGQCKKCQTPIDPEVGEIMECPSQCGCWYLRTETTLRMAYWKEQDADGST